MLGGTLGWLLAAAGEVRAQNGPLVADRPDFTEAAATVGRGVLQIGAGLNAEARDFFAGIGFAIRFR